MNDLAHILVSLVLFACVGNAAQAPAVKQGVLGKITLREGNFMPGPNRQNPPASAAPEKVPSREIYIFELTNLSQVKSGEGFYKDIKTKQIAKVITGPDGMFQVALKPGKYSLFSKEPQGFFANNLDGEGNIYPVTVTPNRLTLVDFVIDYNASY